jgi:PST family polysaccharide transporter/antigen flippase
VIAYRKTFLIGLGHLAKLLTGFVMLKLVAYYLGAEGLGRLGHFMSLASVVTLLAGGGVINGVVKYVAEYRQDPERLSLFIAAAYSYSILFSVAALFIGVAFSVWLSEITLQDKSYYWVVILLFISQLALAYSNLVVGVANGLNRTHVYTAIQTVGAALSIFVVWWLLSSYEWQGALIGVVAILVVPFAPAYYLAYKNKFFFKIKLTFKYDANVYKLAKYTLMLAVSAVAFPIVEFVVRQYIIDSIGYHSAGLWQGAVRLSSAYTGLFSIFLAYAFVPLVSGQEDKAQINKIIQKFLKYVAAAFVLGAVSFYSIRDVLIPLLLSDGFVELDGLIGYQLIGDFFKICAYVIGFLAVAKAATLVYILAEVVQASLYLTLSYLFGQSYVGVEGVFLGYVATYIVYFLLSLVGLFYYLRQSNNAES